MERKQALIVSAVVTAAVMLVAVVFTLNTTLLDARGDDVGNLKVASTQPAEVTVYVDPATGATSLTAPPTTVPSASPSASPSSPSSPSASAGATATPVPRSDRENDHEDHEDDHGGDHEEGERDD